MKGYNSSIDGLRFFAIAPVIGYHFAPSTIPGGFIGVDIFFVISGFLITRMILDKEEFSYSSFYARRIKRLFPGLVLLYFGVVALGILNGHPKLLLRTAEGLLSSLLINSNHFFMMSGGYFGDSVRSNPVLHTWSLSVEEQFYLVFPFFFVSVLGRWGYKALSLILVACIFAGLLLSFFFGFSGMERVNFFFIGSRFWELLLGCFLAVKFKTLMMNSVIRWKMLPFISIAVLVLSFFFYDKEYPHPGILLIPILLATSALILSCFVYEQPAYRFLSFAPFVHVGLLSYSLYLFHWPVVALGLFESNPVLRLFLVYVVSAISFYLVERWYRNSSFRNKTVFYHFSFVSITFVAVCLWIISEDGFIDDFPAYKKVVAESYWESSLNASEDCRKLFGDHQYCKISDIEKPVTDILIGDSHANHIYFAMAELLAKRGRNLLLLGVGGCPPLLNVQQSFNSLHGRSLNCHENFEKIFELVKVIPSVKNTYISFYHGSLFNERVSLYNVHDESLNSLGDDRFGVFSVLETLGELAKTSEDVVFIEDVPEVTFDDYLDCSLEVEDIGSCTSSLRILEHPEGYVQLVREVSENYDVLSLSGVNKSFPFSRDGNALYRDNDHLSVKGSRELIPLLDRQL